MTKFEPTEEQILKVAKAIRGPHLPVPHTSRWTLDELREVRWSNITTNEKNGYKMQAKAALIEAHKVLVDEAILTAT